MTKKGLGKGLGSLLPEAKSSRPVDVFFEPKDSFEKMIQKTGGYLQNVPLSQIRPNPKQPRKSFSDSELQELANSIKLVGVLEPIRVRQKTESGQTFYELIMGERRTRAAELAGLTEIPAIVQFTEEDDLLRLALFENIHRVDLSPLEEAAAYQQLMNDFGYTQNELAAQVAKARSTISNTLRILKLPPSVLAKLENGTISKGHANALGSLSDDVAIEQIANRIEKENLSVRDVEQIVYSPTVVSLDKPPQPRKGQLSELLSNFERNLENYFNTPVEIRSAQRKPVRGSISIRFASEEDLQRIINLISPELSFIDD
jgi:ParB family chromosome partitioning protein